MKRHRFPPRLIALLAAVLPLALAAVIVLNMPHAAPENAQEDAAQTVMQSGDEAAAQETASVNPDSPSIEQAVPSSGPEAGIATARTDPAQLSLIELFEQLGDRARAGDAVAACELGHVVAGCRMHLATYHHPAQSSATGKELDQFIEREASRQEDVARMTRRCEGMNRTHQAEAALFTARAGLAGHSDSLIALSQLPQDAPAEFISNPQLIELYRSQLWPALRRALASNHPQVAAAVMLHLSSPMGSPVAGVVPDAYRNPQVAAVLVKQLSPGISNMMMLGGFYPPPSPKVLETAALWTDELFGGRLPEPVSLEELMRYATPDSASTCAEPEAWLDIR